MIRIYINHGGGYEYYKMCCVAKAKAYYVRNAYKSDARGITPVLIFIKKNRQFAKVTQGWKLSPLINKYYSKKLINLSSTKELFSVYMHIYSSLLFLLLFLRTQIILFRCNLRNCILSVRCIPYLSRVISTKSTYHTFRHV